MLGAMALLLGAYVFARGALLDVTHEADAVVRAVRGTSLPWDSAANHVQDLVTGWHYASAAPFLGVGVRSPQLPGLAAPGPSFYVHNEFLYDWLRWGLPAVVLVIALVGAGILAGLRVLRGDASSSEVAAATILLIQPVTLMTAPFLATTARWPILFGMALGGACSASRRRNQRQGGVESARTDQSVQSRLSHQDAVQVQSMTLVSARIGD